MQVSELSTWFLNSLNDFELKSKKELRYFITNSKKTLKELAPVDSGNYKGSWKSEYNKGHGRLYNETHYGPTIELGSKPGHDPWPNPGKKTTLSNGRIFSTQAIGGTVNKVINEQKIQDLTNIIGNLINSFK